PGTAAERLSVDDRWWRATLADGRARTAMDHSGFPDDLAVRARDAGFRSTWVLPLCDAAADEVIGCLVVWVRIAAEPNITNETGVRQAECLAGLVIGEQRRLDALRHEALTDPLTRVANRSALQARFDASVDPLTVAIIDLDGFKSVNDIHGHEAGDAVLQVVAQRIVGAVRQGDLVVRLGGDEFAVVFAAGTPTEGMVRSMDRVVDSIGSPIQVGALTVSVRASAGLATGRPPEVMQEADRALYDAKGTRTFDPEGRS
ncbi:MAG: GGDEF domain-containing protein, partial [Candidatus Limnocylindrales bacterium]